jgi:hypothetical protein
MPGRGTLTEALAHRLRGAPTRLCEQRGLTRSLSWLVVNQRYRKGECPGCLKAGSGSCTGLA